MTVGKGDGYLLVTAKLKSKREDSMGFDDMKWSYVERALV